MTREEIRLQVAISVIQGVLEAKHGVIGEVVPSVAVAIALRIADAFVEEWYRETKEQPGEDLEKEIEKCLKQHDMVAIGKKDFTDIARHFYELGLKARKGDNPIEWTRVDSLPGLFSFVDFNFVMSGNGVYGLGMRDGVITMIGEHEKVLRDSYFIPFQTLLSIKKS